MKTVTLEISERRWLYALVRKIAEITDPSAVMTKSSVFVRREAVEDLNRLYLCLGRTGTWAKICEAPENELSGMANASKAPQGSSATTKEEG